MLHSKDSNTEPTQIKYPKPKVLLLDVPDAESEQLIAKGFNVSVGTLGTPYRVERGDGFLPMIGTPKLPNYREQEIIVVQLHVGDYAFRAYGEKRRPDGEPDIWAKRDRGLIDPRPCHIPIVRDSFNRTLRSGGVFVVFADTQIGIELVVARLDSRGYGKDLEIQNRFPFGIWNFIDELDDITVSEDHGMEMHAVDHGILGQLLARHLDGGQFLCTVEGGHRSEDSWMSLAENKFGQPVSICRCRGTQGTVIIVPQIADKGGFLASLLTSVLPELSPHLFPHIGQGMWVHHEEYELPRVLELKAEQAAIEEHALAEIAELEIQLADERTTNGWLHDILNGTDTPLVEGVKQALAEIGFTTVIDVDEERDREGKSRREDLQICDISPTLVVDIKGIGGFPSDDDALQADKHATIRMREQSRTDIIGLSIINHQRHLPPLERENVMPFRQELLDVAHERMLGLMTAWDLYRLIRNSRKLYWRHEDVKPLLYRRGRIEVLPLHYHYIGSIAKVWSDKFGVVIAEGELRIGERIAIEFPIDFEEADISSIYVDDTAMQCAVIGDPAGLLWPVGKPRLREGLRVFRIANVP